jgi:hypothetical protein
MSFDPGPPRERGNRRWAVRLFETSDKLEEHLNRSNLRPDQVASVSIDADGFFVLVYYLGPPPTPWREGRVPDFAERRPPARRRFDENEDVRGDEGGFRPRRGGFDRGGSRGGGRDAERGGERDGGARRGLPPRRTPRG